MIGERLENMGKNAKWIIPVAVVLLLVGIGIYWNHTINKAIEETEIRVTEKAKQETKETFEKFSNDLDSLKQLRVSDKVVISNLKKDLNTYKSKTDKVIQSIEVMEQQRQTEREQHSKQIEILTQKFEQSEKQGKITIDSLIKEIDFLEYINSQK